MFSLQAIFPYAGQIGMTLLRPDRFVWLLLAFLFLLWFVVSLSWPMGRDQGILAWVGWGILQGGQPYKDLWDVKGPGAYYPFALAQWLFGHNMWGIRVIDAAFQLLGISAIIYCARQIGDRRTGFIAAALGMLLYMTRGWWNTSQPDGWMASLLIVAVAAIAVGTRDVSMKRLFMFGFCIGLCITVKPFYGLLLVLLFPSLLRKFRCSPVSVLQPALAACVGLAIPLIVVTLWFASHHALRDLYSVLFVFNEKVHMWTNRRSLFGHLTQLNYVTQQPAFSACIVAAILGMYQLAARNVQAFWTILLWLGAALICIILQSKYYLYQVSPLFPAIAIFAAVGIRSLDEVVPSVQQSSFIRRPRPSTLVAACLILLYSWNVVLYVHDWTKIRVGSIDPKEYATYFQGISKTDYSFSTMQAVSDYVKAHTSPRDTVEVWGWDPLINFLSARASPTRFGYDYPLQIANPFEESYRTEFLRNISNNPPLYVLVPDMDDNGSGLMEQSSEASFKAFAPFHDFVTQNYRLEKQIEQYRIWRKRGTLNATR